MKILECPLCNKNIYLEIGKGCKMCGMVLKNRNNKFCSNICKKEYRKINNLNK